jgi:acetyl-CoA acetyltransferase
VTWTPGACAVVGIGTTDFSKNSGRSPLTLAAQAAHAALADAGLTAADVDGIVRNDMDTIYPAALADALGVPDLGYWGDAGPGGSGPAAMVGQAVAAINAGLATTVVVFRSLNGRSGLRYGKGAAAGDRAGGEASYEDLFLPYGMQTPGQFFALLAQDHANRYGKTQEGLAEIALACREHANANPAAQFHDRPMTLESYYDSRMLSTPLRLFDYCLETDGACAVVVTSSERAKDLRHKPAYVASVAQAAGPEPQPGLMFPMLTRADMLTTSGVDCARRLFDRAGLTASDVDVAQVYDCFTITALLQLEDYGFCGRGEGGEFAAAGHLRIGGDLPMNTSGGHLSEGYLHGMNHVAEGVRQIRGTSTTQVPGAEVSLVTSAPPPGASALLLTSEAS